MVTILVTVSVIYNNLWMKRKRRQRRKVSLSHLGDQAWLQSQHGEHKKTHLDVLRVWGSSWWAFEHYSLNLSILCVWWCSLVLQESPRLSPCTSGPVLKALASVCRLYTSFHSSYLEMILNASSKWKIENLSSLQWKTVKSGNSKGIFFKGKEIKIELFNK